MLYTSYSQDEIQAAEALLCSFTTHEKPLASPAQELTVFPWGGMTSNGVLLSNTCPLDNWLMIFQALVKSGMVNLADLHESGQTIATALRLIECGQYADAKLLIIQSLQHPHQDMSRHFSQIHTIHLFLNYEFPSYSNITLTIVHVLVHGCL